MCKPWLCHCLPPQWPPADLRGDAALIVCRVCLQEAEALGRKRKLDEQDVQRMPLPRPACLLECRRPVFEPGRVMVERRRRPPRAPRARVCTRAFEARILLNSVSQLAFLGLWTAIVVLRPVRPLASGEAKRVGRAQHQPRQVGAVPDYGQQQEGPPRARRQEAQVGGRQVRLRARSCSAPGAILAARAQARLGRTAQFDKESAAQARGGGAQAA